MAHGDNEKSGAVFLPHRCTTEGRPLFINNFPRDFTVSRIDKYRFFFPSSPFNLSILFIEFISSSKVIRGKGRYFVLLEGES